MKKGKVVKVRRFPAMHGWSNRILFVDLSDMSVLVEETGQYVPTFLGGRGIAIKIAWDRYPEPVKPFDAENPLMIFPGAVTGARSPYSGRTNVCGFGPQGYPHPWFTRSSMGGHFGGELKRAGYDGIIVTGASEEPVYILIRDDQISILPADDLWGQDALQTIQSLQALERGKGYAVTIGLAGERKSRIATIQTASSSACGQGGFGAVMGSKNLKAIFVIGSGQVKLADQERVTEISRAVGAEARTTRRIREQVTKVNAELAARGGGRVRPYACTEGCLSPCGLYYEDVPGRSYDCTWSGHWFCVGELLRGVSDGRETSALRRDVYGWNLGVRGGLEINSLFNRYGLNQWDVIVGMVPWLAACQKAGLVSDLNGRAMDWHSCEFWDQFLRAIAYREGMGDVLAEGGWAAARVLHLGESLVQRYYTGWGYAGHWDGHGDCANRIVFPYWLVAALQWLTDTRDPIPSGHGYVWRVMQHSPLANNSPISWDQMREISARVYGDARAVDPNTGYEAKSRAAFYHVRRSVIKDCLSADDFVFPLIYSPNTADRFCRVAGIEGPSVEYHLFKAGTGTEWSEREFELAAERIYTLERALTVRHWGRDRTMDELILPSFEYPENWVNPLLGEHMALDRERFSRVMDEYYGYLGWDAETGWPTQARMDKLGLGDLVRPSAQQGLSSQG